MSQRVDGPVSRQVDEPVSRPVDEPVGQRVDEPVSQRVDGPVNRQVDGPVGRRVDEPPSHPVDEPVNHQVGDPWTEGAPGILRLPSGRLVRGRGLRRALDPAAPTPSYAVYLLGSQPPEVPWEFRWIDWPDFRLPKDRADARAALGEVWERAAGERVEVACGGGRGRTGTALACLAVLDGCRPTRRWRMCAPVTTGTPWRRPGSGGTSGGSSEGVSQVQRHDEAVRARAEVVLARGGFGQEAE